jgi:hypothetical protein
MGSLEHFAPVVKTSTAYSGRLEGFMEIDSWLSRRNAFQFHDSCLLGI